MSTDVDHESVIYKTIRTEIEAATHRYFDEVLGDKFVPSDQFDYVAEAVTAALSDWGEGMSAKILELLK